MEQPTDTVASQSDSADSADEQSVASDRVWDMFSEVLDKLQQEPVPTSDIKQQLKQLKNAYKTQGDQYAKAIRENSRLTRKVKRLEEKRAEDRYNHKVQMDEQRLRYEEAIATLRLALGQHQHLQLQSALPPPPHAPILPPLRPQFLGGDPQQLFASRMQQHQEQAAYLQAPSTSQHQHQEDNQQERSDAAEQAHRNLQEARERSLTEEAARVGLDRSAVNGLNSNQMITELMLKSMTPPIHHLLTPIPYRTTPPALHHLVHSEDAAHPLVRQPREGAERTPDGQVASPAEATELQLGISREVARQLMEASGSQQVLNEQARRPQPQPGDGSTSENPYDMSGVSALPATPTPPLTPPTYGNQQHDGTVEEGAEAGGSTRKRKHTGRSQSRLSIGSTSSNSPMEDSNKKPRRGRPPRTPKNGVSYAEDDGEDGLSQVDLGVDDMDSETEGGKGGKADGKLSRRYECEVCWKTFSTSGHLSRHRRIHTGTKPHKCPIETCTMRFTRHDNMMQHWRTHILKSKPNSSGLLLDLEDAKRMATAEILGGLQQEMQLQQQQQQLQQQQQQQQMMGGKGKRAILSQDRVVDSDAESG